MKKNLLILASFFGMSAVTSAQTLIANSADLTITTANSVTCNGGTNTVENRFFCVFDLDNYANITDTAFFVRMQVAIESTSGGAYDVVAKMHNVVGAPLLANMTLIVSDTTALTPDASAYLMNIPFQSGYSLPGDSIMGEFNLPINAAITVFPGSNVTPGSSATYIIADGCGILEVTDISTLGFPDMNIIMNVYANQKPTMSGYSTSVMNNSQIDFVSTDFTANFNDNDNDGLTMLRVVTLPANGILDLSGTTLVVGDTVLENEIVNLSYVPNSGYVGAESFSVVARDSSHWSNTPAAIDITVNDFQAGLDANAAQSPVKVYPNPASEFITISAPAAISEIRIIDLNGKKIMAFITSETELNIEGLAAGSYVIEVVTAEGVYTNQLVVE